MKRRKGFTLIELLVVVGIIALLMTILLPGLAKAKELVRQSLCMANVTGIHKGWAIYTTGNNDEPPLLPDVDQLNDSYYAKLKMGPTCTVADLGSNAQQNLCLLVKDGSVQWKMFICPSVSLEAMTREGEDERYGFGDTYYDNYCTYGIQMPYNNMDPSATRRNWAPLSAIQEVGEMVYLGDAGPKRDESNTSWSPNHPEDGETILYTAGNVRFSQDKRNDDVALDGDSEQDKNAGGYGGNNVYTQDVWDQNDFDTDTPTLISNGVNRINLPASTRDTVLYDYKVKR